jgi:hypothetical protein
MSIAFGDEEEMEPEIVNTDAVEEEIDFLLEEEEPEQSKFEWVIWVLLSSVCFAVCNLLIADLQRYSYETQAIYYNSGGLLVAVVYCNFSYTFKRNRVLKTGKIYRRLYTDPETRTCDWIMLVLVILAAVS